MTKDKRSSTVKRGRPVIGGNEHKRLKLNELSEKEKFYGFSKDDKFTEMHRLPIINRIISQNSQDGSYNSPDITQVIQVSDTTKNSDVACQTSPDLHIALLLEMFPGIAPYIDDIKQTTPVTTKQVCSTPDTKMTKFARVKTPMKKLNRNDNLMSSVTPDVPHAEAVDLKDMENRNTSFVSICNSTTLSSNIISTNSVSSKNKKMESNSLNTNEVQPFTDFSKKTIEEIIFSGNNTTVTNISKTDFTSSVTLGMNNNKYTPTINKDVSFNEMISPIPLESGIQVNRKYRGVHTMKSTPAINENFIEGFRTPVTNLHSDMKPVSETTQSELENLNKIFENDVLKPGYTPSPDLTKSIGRTKELLCGVDLVASKSNNSSPVKSEKEGSVGSQELFRDDSSIELDEEVDTEVTLKHVANNTIDEIEYCAVEKKTNLEEISKLKDKDAKMELFVKEEEKIDSKPEFIKMKHEKNFTNSKNKIIFSTSRWNNVKLIGMFENLFDAKYNNKLTTGMTHLIVKTEEGNTTDPTYKYLYAMINGICIVSDKWLTDSLQANSIVPECEYIPLDSSGEPGPLTSYKLSLQGSVTPSWLNNFCLMFAKPYLFGYSLAEIQGLALKIGATVVNNEEEFDKYEKFHKVVVFADEVPQKDAKELGTDLLKKYNAVPVYFFWLVNMIGIYKVCSFYEHVMIDLSYDRLVQLKFPPQFISPCNNN